MIPAPRRLVLAAALAAPAIARAQQQRPVTIIVPFAAGGSTDVLSRLMAERMTQTLGQTVLVENRAGGNTIVGAEYVARAQPDGNTLLMAAGTTLRMVPLILSCWAWASAVSEVVPFDQVNAGAMTRRWRLL